MMMLCLKLIFEFASFIKLRLSLPHAERPYKVPGGWTGVFLITLPKLIVVGFTLFTMDAFSFWSGLAINLLASLLYGLKMLLMHSLSRYSEGETPVGEKREREIKRKSFFGFSSPSVGNSQWSCRSGEATPLLANGRGEDTK